MNVIIPALGLFVTYQMLLSNQIQQGLILITLLLILMCHILEVTFAMLEESDANNYKMHHVPTCVSTLLKSSLLLYLR